MSDGRLTRFVLASIVTVVVVGCRNPHEASRLPRAVRGHGSLALAFEATCTTTETRDVACWGWNVNGEMGRGTVDDRRHDETIVPGVHDVVSVAALGSDVCALDAKGSVACWGGKAHRAVYRPSLVAPAHAITVSHSFACALVDGGDVWCWHTTDGAASPYREKLVGATQITAGESHVCALNRDGSIACAGTNAWGELGAADPRLVPSSDEPLRVHGISHATTISAGLGHTCAVASGHVLCWGANDQVQLGTSRGIVTRGDIDLAFVPVRVEQLEHVRSVSAGADQTCAVTVEGAAFCWGHASSFRRDAPKSAYVSRAEVVRRGVSDVVAGEGRTCFILEGGSVECAGEGSPDRRP